MGFTVRPRMDGWIIEGSETPQRFSRQQDAATEARRQLRESAMGGTLTIHDGHDIARSVERVAGATALSVLSTSVPSVEPAGLIGQVKSEGEHIDRALEIGLPLLGSAGAAWLSPEVAAADGWLGVFFATLALSLGCLLAIVVAQTSGLQGYPLMAAVSAVMLVAVAVASGLGTGVLEISTTDLAISSNPYFKIPVAVLASAVQTWGIAGAILGGGIGIWLGVRISARIKPTA